MKPICLFGLTILLFGTPALSQDFSDHLKLCHDTVWGLNEFKDLPNAAVSVHPGGYDDNSFSAYWIIDWDELQVAGKCIMEFDNPKITDLTDFRKL